MVSEELRELYKERLIELLKLSAQLWYEAVRIEPDTELEEDLMGKLRMAQSGAACYHSKIKLSEVLESE